MNAERLRAAVDLLLDIEKKAEIQTSLEHVVEALSALVQNPTADHQTALSDKLGKFDSSLRAVWSALNSAQVGAISDLGAERHFRPGLADEIRKEMAANAMTPAVLFSAIQSQAEERKSFLNVLRNTRSGLRNLGIDPVKLEPGEADISVLLPRSLFQNDLDGLQKELRTLSGIFRVFYELSNVTPGRIEVREISTSDPTFFLGIDVAPLIALGLAIKWCIDVVKGGHDIKKIADAARHASVDDDLVKKLTDQIQKRVDDQLNQRVREMLEQFKGDAARRNELEGPTRLALEQLLQRIERGLIIEIRTNPPMIEAEENERVVQIREQFEKLDEIASSLEYPRIEGEPVLQLTVDEPKTAERG